MMDSIGSQHLRLLLQVIFFSFFLSCFFFSHTKKLIVQVVRSRPHVFLMKSFCIVCILATFFSRFKEKENSSQYLLLLFFRSQGINKASDMFRLVEKKEVVFAVYRQQTNCTLGKNCFVFRLRSSVACSKFCHDFFLVFASVTPIFIVYFFLGTAVSRRFKTSNNQEFFFTPCFHNIFLFVFSSG